MKYRLIPHVNHLDVPITWINEKLCQERITPVQCSARDQLVGFDTKHHGGVTLQNKFMSLMGYINYPPPQSDHYTLLTLGEYNTRTHRGTFLKQKRQQKSEESLDPKSD